VWFIEATDYRSNFVKTILFENCSCFSKIPFSISVISPRIFQCLVSIPAGHWLQQIDGDLHCRFFLSALLSLVISKTGRSERSARALRDGADVVCEARGIFFSRVEFWKFKTLTFGCKSDSGYSKDAGATGLALANLGSFLHLNSPSPAPAPALSPFFLGDLGRRPSYQSAAS